MKTDIAYALFIVAGYCFGWYGKQCSKRWRIARAYGATKKKAFLIALGWN